MWLGEWVRGYWHKGRLKSEIRKRDWVCLPAFSKCYYITVTLRQHNYKRLPCWQSFTWPPLMDVSHTGDSVLLSPRHLTSLYLRLPWRRGRALMLMTVGSSCPPECCQDGIKHTHWVFKGHTNTLTHTQQPAPNNPKRHGLTFSKRQRWHICPFQSKHTKHMHKHTVQSHWGHWKYPVTHTSPAVWWHKKVNWERWVHLYNQQHTAALNSKDKANWLQKSE